MSKKTYQRTAKNYEELPKSIYSHLNDFDHLNRAFKAFTGLRIVIFFSLSLCFECVMVIVL